MKFIKLLFVVFALFSTGAFAQSLTSEQKSTLRASLLAETDPVIVAAVAARTDYTIAAWCNSPSATDAWLANVPAKTLFEAMDITKYDSLTSGKRASWDLMLQYSPLDMGRNKLRSAVVDVWGNTDSIVVLQALREKATNCQMYFGGTSKTTNTVTGLDRAWSGLIGGNEISYILNGGN